MKCYPSQDNQYAYVVASFAEAWIEMLNAIDGKCCSCVASFAEAWIEIIFPLDLGVLRSRLLRGGVD